MNRFVKMQREISVPTVRRIKVDCSRGDKSRIVRSDRTETDLYLHVHLTFRRFWHDGKHPWSLGRTESTNFDSKFLNRTDRFMMTIHLSENSRVLAPFSDRYNKKSVQLLKCFKPALDYRATLQKKYSKLPGKKVYCKSLGIRHFCNKHSE